MKRFLFVVAVTAVTLLCFTFLSKSSADNREQEHEHSEKLDFKNISLTATQVKTVNLKMDEVKRRELDSAIDASGNLVLRSKDMGDVTSLTGGIVKSILVKDGQKVHKGQVVATIENTDIVSLQREYFSANKEVQLTHLDLERQQNLAKNGAGVKKNLQQTEKNYQVAQANLLGIKNQLQQMGINVVAVSKGHFTTVFPLRAPISGTVSQVTASIGSFADMQTPLMKIRNNDAVECDLNIFERDLGKVKVGDKVWVTLINQHGVNIAGHVYGINEYFNEGTKSISVHVKLDATQGAKLFDGMYVSGKIVTGRQLCNTLPSKAIFKLDGKSYIFVLDSKSRNYVFSRHEVTTGVSEGGLTEVSLCKHVQKGKKIVTENAFYLASLTGEHGEHEH